MSTTTKSAAPSFVPELRSLDVPRKGAAHDDVSALWERLPGGVAAGRKRRVARGA